MTIAKAGFDPKIISSNANTVKRYTENPSKALAFFRRHTCFIVGGVVSVPAAVGLAQTTQQVAYTQSSSQVSEASKMSAEGQYFEMFSNTKPESVSYKSESFGFVAEACRVKLGGSNYDIIKVTKDSKPYAVYMLNLAPNEYTVALGIIKDPNTGTFKVLPLQLDPKVDKAPIKSNQFVLLETGGMVLSTGKSLVTFTWDALFGGRNGGFTIPSAASGLVNSDLSKVKVKIDTDNELGKVRIFFGGNDGDAGITVSQVSGETSMHWLKTNPKFPVVAKQILTPEEISQAGIR